MELCLPQGSSASMLVLIHIKLFTTVLLTEQQSITESYRVLVQKFRAHIVTTQLNTFFLQSIKFS